MHELGFEYKSVTSSRYANGLLRHVRTYEPEKLVDKLICVPTLKRAPVNVCQTCAVCFRRFKQVLCVSVAL